MRRAARLQHRPGRRVLERSAHRRRDLFDVGLEEDAADRREFAVVVAVFVAVLFASSSPSATIAAASALVLFHAAAAPPRRQRLRQRHRERRLHHPPLPVPLLEVRVGVLHARQRQRARVSLEQTRRQGHRRVAVEEARPAVDAELPGPGVGALDELAADLDAEEVVGRGEARDDGRRRGRRRRGGTRRARPFFFFVVVGGPEQGEAEAPRAAADVEDQRPRRVVKVLGPALWGGYRDLFGGENCDFFFRAGAEKGKRGGKGQGGKNSLLLLSFFLLLLLPAGPNEGGLRAA